MKTAWIAIFALAITFSLRAQAASTADVPGRTSSTNQPFGFRVKGTAPALVRGYPDLTPVLSQLPVDKRNKPTLVGLSKLTITIDNSAVFSAGVDAHGKASGQFKAYLMSNGHLSVQFPNFDVTGLLMVSTQTDGIFQTPPISIVLSITDAQGNTSVLFSKPDLVITYKVRNGVAVATAAH